VLLLGHCYAVPPKRGIKERNNMPTRGTVEILKIEQSGSREYRVLLRAEGADLSGMDGLHRQKEERTNSLPTSVAAKVFRDNPDANYYFYVSSCVDELDALKRARERIESNNGRKRGEIQDN